jgi:hypothetical protein
MSKPLIDRIPFAKIVTVFAILFAVSLGLCGLTFALSMGRNRVANVFMSFGVLELIAMALSAAGLVLTSAVWVALAIIGSFQDKVSQPQKLFGDEDDTKLDKKG